MSEIFKYHVPHATKFTHSVWGQQIKNKTGREKRIIKKRTPNTKSPNEFVDITVESDVK